MPVVRRQVAPGPGEPSAPTGAGQALAGLPAPVDPYTVDRFWMPPVPLPDRPAALPAAAGALRRQLATPGPELGGPGLLDKLRLAYDAFAES